jgi:hypothetical protein
MYVKGDRGKYALIMMVSCLYMYVKGDRGKYALIMMVSCLYMSVYVCQGS